MTPQLTAILDEFAEHLALERGRSMAAHLLERGLIVAAAMHLQGRTRIASPEGRAAMLSVAQSATAPLKARRGSAQDRMTSVQFCFSRPARAN